MSPSMDRDIVVFYICFPFLYISFCSPHLFFFFFFAYWLIEFGSLTEQHFVTRCGSISDILISDHCLWYQSDKTYSRCKEDRCRTEEGRLIRTVWQNIKVLLFCWFFFSGVWGQEEDNLTKSTILATNFGRLTFSLPSLSLSSLWLFNSLE